MALERLKGGFWRKWRVFSAAMAHFGGSLASIQVLMAVIRGKMASAGGSLAGIRGSMAGVGGNLASVRGAMRIVRDSLVLARGSRTGICVPLIGIRRLRLSVERTMRVARANLRTVGVAIVGAAGWRRLDLNTAGHALRANERIRTMDA